MTHEEKSRVLKEEVFYHITPRENLPSIKTTGLDPLASDQDIYGRFLKQPAVFLCTTSALAYTKSMFDNGHHIPHVVIEIPASAVAQHECDVDHSFPDHTRGLTFVECLDQAGVIACYGGIPPSVLEVVEHQDEQGHWQQGE